MGGSRIDIAREIYEAFATGDRDVLERHLSKEFKFSAPPDPLLDRDGYFERCWPGAGRGRNTEILTFDGDQIVRAEVYFGWEL
jgi:hypothetical protein